MFRLTRQTVLIVLACVALIAPGALAQGALPAHQSRPPPQIPAVHPLIFNSATEQELEALPGWVLPPPRRSLRRRTLHFDSRTSDEGWRFQIDNRTRIQLDGHGASGRRNSAPRPTAEPRSLCAFSQSFG